VLQSGGQDGGVEEEYKNWKWLDARLTELGRSQASALRPTMAATQVDVVLVSPLSRTIETALLAIPPGPRFILEESIRERCGTHPCDKRRSRAELASDYPTIDLSAMKSEEDDYWTEVREPQELLVARSAAFLGLIRDRPELNISVVTHNDFLKALLFESGLAFADRSLQRTFANCEALTVAITWGDEGSASPAATTPSSAASSASATETA
jgi:glucosyl-3-phosphoglycerate phosphatase